MKEKLGINMGHYCRDHETRIVNALKKHDASNSLLELHLMKLQWVQHERLIHLIVVVMTLIGDLFLIGLAVFCPEMNPIATIMVLILTVLLGFYFAHYFFLENTVQRWYILAEKMRDEIKSKK